MKNRIAPLVLTMFGLLGMSTARAGLLDDPPPPLADGRAAVVVYRLGPVHFDPGEVDTIVTCTNATDEPVEIVFEVFDETDVRVGLVTRVVSPAGGRVSFTTATDADAVAVSGLPPLEHGKGRVSAATARIACAGKHRIRGEDGVTKESSLELVKKIARSE